MIHNIIIKNIQFPFLRNKSDVILWHMSHYLIRQSEQQIFYKIFIIQ